jgi:Domain of unknown function (DUF6894)
MTRVYFHLSSSDHVLLDCSTADVADMTEARDRATATVRAMIAGGGQGVQGVYEDQEGQADWRDWMLHVSDDLGEMLFSLPFKSLMGPLH